MSQTLNNAWDWTKGFFKYSGTIVVARITMFSGFATAAIGAMDWSPLYNLVGTDTGLTHKQVIWSGVITFSKGLFDEYVRRRSATFPVA